MSRNVGRTPPGRLCPAALADARRVLDGAARRLLAAQLNGQSVGATAGGNGDGQNHGPDERAPLVQGEIVPVPGGNGDGRGLRGGEAV